MKSLLAVTGLSRTMAIVVVSVAVLGGATGIYVTTSSGKAPTSVTDVDGERPAGADSVTPPSADEVEKAAAAAAAAEAARVQAEADAAAVAAEVAQALSDTTAGRPAASGQQQAPAAAPPVQQEGGGTVVRVDGPGPVYTNATQEEVDRLLTEHQDQTNRPGCQPGMLGC
jgi:hypothetical protein